MPNAGVLKQLMTAVFTRIRLFRIAVDSHCRLRASARVSRLPGWIKLRYVLVPATLVLAVTACNDQSGFPFAEEPAIAPDAVIQPTAASGDQTPEASPDSRQLVVWLPDFAGYGDDGNAGEVLQSAFRQFEQDHPSVSIEVQEKATTGQSDILSYLRNAQRVAPSILPDLALVDSQQLWQLVDIGLLQPIETPPMERSPDFYQFALDSTRYKDSWYAIPFSADVLHLADYPPQDADVPANWGDVLTVAEPYLYAAAGADAFQNGAVLLQYVGAGGQLLEDGSTTSEEALRSVFNFVVAGSEDGVIPPSVMELATLDAVWNGLLEQGIGFGNISASDYLANRETAPEIGYAQIPTRQGLPTTLGTTWSFIVLGEDPAQRSLAFELIDDLLAPSIQGVWAQYANRLPTQRTALQAWTNATAYTDFLSRQLEVAVALPNGRAFADFADRLLMAQQGVLGGDLTPQEAVAQVRGPG
jgi:ABC-type glycerol-3-phosphate transport system substrate-binding protein